MLHVYLGLVAKFQNVDDFGYCHPNYHFHYSRFNIVFLKTLLILYCIKSLYSFISFPVMCTYF